MKLYLIFLNVWIAAVYYMIYCEPRSYNSALAGFWESWPSSGFMT